MRASSTWANSLHSQADALLACDFLETVTLSGAWLYVFAVIEHSSRRIRILGATAHPTATWVAQAAKNLVMDLEDAGRRVRFLIRNRDGKYPRPVRHHPQQCGDPGGTQRRTGAAHELDLGTVGTDLPT